MEALMDLVAASFARNGIECPPSEYRLGEGRTRVSAEPTPSMSKGALNHTADQGSAPAGSTGNSQSTVQMAQSPIALPEHNYRKSLQGDPAP